jgi:hypothetical protein
MKAKCLLSAGFALVLAAVGVVVFKKTQESPPLQEPIAATTTVVKVDGMDLITKTDSTWVFQKAFWRRPTSADKIFHAERREWSTEDGVKKWQWFIDLQPSPQLLEWLETNPFSMAKSASLGNFEKPPKWFPRSSSNFQIQQNAAGSFVIMLSPDKKHLYATDSGLGFQSPGQ